MKHFAYLTCLRGCFVVYFIDLLIIMNYETEYGTEREWGEDW